MAEGHSVGKIFVELDLDSSRYLKGQQQLLKDATQTSLNIEQNFKNLGIKSSAVFDLMRAKIQNAYDMIVNNAKSSTDDIVRAEKAKNDQISKLNEQQFGKQTSFIESIKQNWIAASAVIVGAWIVISKVINIGKDMYNLAKSTAEAANAIERQARVIGITTDAYQKLQYAAKMSDVESLELSTGLKLLSRNMEDASQGTGDAGKYLTAMGLSVKDATGNLKPLDTMLREIAEKFASWEDGPRKIAIALALFGRSGEALIPILNQGRTGIDAYGRSAGETGKILSSEMIAKGAEAEKQFKTLEATISTVSKAMVLAIMPTNDFGSAIERMGKKIVDFYSQPKVQEFSKDFILFATGMGQISKAIVSQVQIPEYPSETRFRLPGETKVQPPIVPEKKTAAEEYLAKYGQTEEQIREGLRSSEDYGKRWLDAYLHGGEIEYTRIEERYVKIGESIGKDLQSGLTRSYGIFQLKEFAIPEIATFPTPPVFPEWKEFTGDVAETDLTVQGFMTHINSSGVLVTDTLKTWNEQVKGLREEWKGFMDEDQTVQKFVTTSAGTFNEKQMKDMEENRKTFMDIGSQIESTWSNVFSNMADSTKTFADRVKDSFKSLADSVIQQIMQMMTHWLMWGQLIGTPEKGMGTGLLSILGGLIGLQHGGIVTKPTFAMLAEKGIPEAVIPLDAKKLGGGNTNNYFNINAVDAASFRDICTRYPGAILEQISKDARVNGPMRNL